MYQSIATMRETLRSYEHSARYANLPSVRAFFRDEADRLRMQIVRAEETQSIREERGRFAGRCF